MADVKISGLTAATAANLADEFETNQSGSSKKMTGTVMQSMPRSVNTQTGSTYTLVLADAGKLLIGNSGSGQTFTVPPNSSVAFVVGTQIDLLQFGAGQITVAAGSGVTLSSKAGNLKLTGQYSGATLVKQATNVWVLIGDLAA